MGTNHSHTPSDNSLPDEVLIQRLKIDITDDQVWKALVETHNDFLWMCVSTYLWNPADAEEAVQDVWLRIRQAISKWDSSQGFVALASRIAKNHALNCLQKLSNRVKTATLDSDDGDDDSRLQRLPTQYSLPESRLEGEERVRWVEAALARLPPKHRAVVHLKFFANQEFHEIAEHLGVPIGTVASRCNRAMKRLKGLLGPNESASA